MKGIQEVKTLAFLLIYEVFGLYLGKRLVDIEIVQPQTGAAVGVGLLLYVVVVTALIILIIKYWKKVLKLMELVTIFLGSELFLEMLLIDVPNVGLLTVPLALLVTYLRVVYPKSELSKNLGISLAILGVGPFLGASLGIWASWTFIALLAIYDYISVFKTKHMVYLAKNVIEENLAFTASTALGKREVNVGGGDLIAPMLLSVSVYRYSGLLSAVFVVLGGTLSMFALLVWVSRRKKPVPAIPAILLGSLLGYLAALVVMA